MRIVLLAVVLTSLGCGDARADAPAARPAVERSVSAPVAPAPEPLRGEWLELGQLGDARHRERSVRAWVPTHAEGARLPVLFVLDGQGASSWFRIDDTLAALAGEGRLEPWIVIAVDSTIDRDRELARVDPRFARFLRDAVLPVARERLPIRPGRESTAVLGYSYGGLAAVAAVVGEPSTFGRAIAMSPSLWVEQRAVLERFERARTLPSRLWIDVGSEEPDPEDLIPYMVSDARNLRDLALHRGMIFGRDVGYLEAMGEAHDMGAGGRRMREALLFALSERDLSGEAPVELGISRYPARHRLSTFAIEARYSRGERLTFPERLVELRAGETRLRRDIAPVGLALTVRAFGLEARVE